MKALLLDGSEKDRHQGLKRWERQAQATALRQRQEEIAAPMLPCPWKSAADGATEYLPGQLLRLYLGDFSLVRFVKCGSGESGLYLLRGGIPWPQWFPRLLQNYVNGVALPAPFQPRRRLPSIWIEAAMHWPTSLQTRWFDQLRSAGLLPALPKLDAVSVLPWLAWEEVKSRFLDFKDSPPLQS